MTIQLFHKSLAKRVTLFNINKTLLTYMKSRLVRTQSHNLAGIDRSGTLKTLSVIRYGDRFFKRTVFKHSGKAFNQNILVLDKLLEENAYNNWRYTARSELVYSVEDGNAEQLPYCPQGRRGRCSSLHLNVPGDSKNYLTVTGTT